MYLKVTSLFAGLIILFSTGFGAAQTLEVMTEAGRFEVDLYADKAPVTVSNFLRYVDAGLMKNTSFYRTVTINPDNQAQSPVKIEVIQGGWKHFEAPRPYPDIPLETTRVTGVKHLNGTISMARDKPNSASSEFFVCVGDQPELDFGGRRNPDGQGFAAFGRVTRGMDVVRAIHQSRNSEQSLTPTIRIIDIRRKQQGWFTEIPPIPLSPAERVLGVHRAIQSSARFWLEPDTKPSDYPGYLVEQLAPFLTKSGLSEFRGIALPSTAFKVFDFLTPDLKKLFDGLMLEVAYGKIDRVTQSIEGNRATVTLFIRSRDFLEGKTTVSQETFQLYRIEGVWYIDASDLAQRQLEPGKSR